MLTGGKNWKLINIDSKENSNHLSRIINIKFVNFNQGEFYSYTPHKFTFMFAVERGNKNV